MKLYGTVQVEGMITVNDEEAKVLNILTSYGLAEWFTEHCNQEMSKEYIEATLSRIRQATARIMEARDAAMKEISRR